MKPVKVKPKMKPVKQEHVELFNSIMEIVSKTTGVPVELMLSRTRKRNVLYPRYAGLHIFNTQAKVGPVHIGWLLGKDHTTARHNSQVISDLLFSQDDEFLELLERCQDAYNAIVIQQQQDEQPMTAIDFYLKNELTPIKNEAKVETNQGANVAA